MAPTELIPPTLDPREQYIQAIGNKEYVRGLYN